MWGLISGGLITEYIFCCLLVDKPITVGASKRKFTVVEKLNLS